MKEFVENFKIKICCRTFADDVTMHVGGYKDGFKDRRFDEEDYSAQKIF